MENEKSLRPIPRWFQTTQNSSFVKAEGRPNGGCRAVKENESRPWLTRRDSNPHLIGYEPTALTVTPQVSIGAGNRI